MNKTLLQAINKLHGRLVFIRRTEVLAKHVSVLLSENAKVLDIGCGDGDISLQVKNARKDIDLVGIEVYKRKSSKIPVTLFDGKKIPYPDNSFDCVIFIDVLHHIDQFSDLFKEAVRVSKQYIILKDHFANTAIDRSILSVMDWVGNKPHGVVLPYNYVSEDTWKKEWEKNNLTVETLIPNLHLYPAPLTYIFDGKKHFMVKLAKKKLKVQKKK